MCIKKYGLLAVLLFILITGKNSSAGPDDQGNNSDNEYIAHLISKSRELNLSSDRYWHTILHYKKTLTGSYKSLVDDPKFFISAAGNTDPRGELEETIKSFFRPRIEDIVHPMEKFSARYAWLKGKLSIDTARLPFDGDTKFYKFYKEINPSSITLVFPAGYLNSPASMYGHTLLLIEAKNGSRLLSRAVNYAAITNETFGPIFAFKGLFGLYKGYYSFLPYYQKIKEYSDGEMRDMWEYNLSLTPHEIEMMLRHIVEMEDIYSDYYFIDENCSYNLLYLIEAAKPETGITDQFGIGVEPIDTLRVSTEKRLVGSINYRPSLYSKIRFLRSKLNGSEQKRVLDFCRGDVDINSLSSNTATDEKKIIMCDLASDYLKFMAIKNDISEVDYKSRFMSILTMRNTLPKLDSYKDITEPDAPEKSHLSRRLSLETGYRFDDIYTQLSYRQSCHELMDPDEGYNMNSEIVFGNIAGRYYYDKKKFQLQSFDIISIVSLPPSDSFFISPCYNLKTGFIQNNNKDRGEDLTYWIKAGSGLSTLFGESIQGYIFAGFRSYFNPEYDNNTDFLAGGESGIFTILGRWKNHIFGQIFHSPFGEKHTRIIAGVSERIKISDSITLQGDYTYNLDYDYKWNEFSAKISFFF